MKKNIVITNEEIGTLAFFERLNESKEKREARIKRDLEFISSSKIVTTKAKRPFIIQINKEQIGTEIPFNAKSVLKGMALISSHTTECDE